MNLRLTFVQCYIVPVKRKVKILQNFVAFSEYMNFKGKQIFMTNLSENSTQFEIRYVPNKKSDQPIPKSHLSIRDINS